MLKMTYKRFISSIIFILILFVYITITNANKSNTYKILVDVEESRLYLFKNEFLEKVYSCSGGKPSTPSPIGTWTIVSKGKWGEGFGGSWMRI